jgi:hypothetical protein
MMKTVFGVILAVVFAIGLVVVPAQAYMETVWMGLKDCPSCYGSAYALSVSEANSVYTVSLYVDTSRYNGSESYISAVDFKVAKDVSDLTLFGTTNTAIDDWMTSEFGISSSGGSGGCESNGKGFVCSETQDATAAKIGGTYSWTWTFTLPDGVKLNLSDAHIGAQYGGGPGQITSESVPEPSTLLLLGTGLLGLGGFAWRRNRKG